MAQRSTNAKPKVRSLILETDTVSAYGFFQQTLAFKLKGVLYLPLPETMGRKNNVLDHLVAMN